jgi:hypothetical protein
MMISNAVAGGSGVEPKHGEDGAMRQFRSNPRLLAF